MATDYFQIQRSEYSMKTEVKALFKDFNAGEKKDSDTSARTVSTSRITISIATSFNRQLAKGHIQK